MPINTITYKGVKYISINDLTSYIDNTAMEFEKVKNEYAVKLLNELAEVLSKIN